MVRKGFNEVGGGARTVGAVGDEVEPVGERVGGSELNERVKMFAGGVLIDLGEKTNEVKGAAGGGDVSGGGEKSGVGEKTAVTDGKRDARVGLVDGAAGADDEMADFAATGFFPREADSDAGGLEGASGKVAAAVLNT